MPNNTLQHNADIQNGCKTNDTATNTAGHCRTLEHTAPQYTTLQHTATHCNTLQHTATQILFYTHAAEHCSMQRHSLQNTAPHSVLQGVAVRCSTLQLAPACMCCSWLHTPLIETEEIVK